MKRLSLIPGLWGLGLNFIFKLANTGFAVEMPIFSLIPSCIQRYIYQRGLKPAITVVAATFRLRILYV